jgi:hypothetical protein
MAMKTKSWAKVCQSPSRGEEIDTVDDIKDLNTRLMKSCDDVDSILCDLIQRIDKRDRGGRVKTTRVMRQEEGK